MVRRYDGVSMTLHWLIALLVAVQFCTKAMSPGSFPGATEDALDAWHLAIGPTILLLMVVRLGWRLTHAVPPTPADLSAALRLVSRVTHWAFYGLLILIPVLGWVSASAFRARPTLLGLVPLPMIAPASESLAEGVGGVHGILAWVVLALIGLHICGALYHLLAKDDGVAARMLPFGRP
jgi:cytochrome b561